MAILIEIKSKHRPSTACWQVVVLFIKMRWVLTLTSARAHLTFLLFRNRQLLPLFFQAVFNHHQDNRDRQEDGRHERGGPQAPNVDRLAADKRAEDDAEAECRDVQRWGDVHCVRTVGLRQDQDVGLEDRDAHEGEQAEDDDVNERRDQGCGGVVERQQGNSLDDENLEQDADRVSIAKLTADAVPDGDRHPVDYQDEADVAAVYQGDPFQDRWQVGEGGKRAAVTEDGDQQGEQDVRFGEDLQLGRNVDSGARCPVLGQDGAVHHQGDDAEQGNDEERNPPADEGADGRAQWCTEGGRDGEAGEDEGDGTGLLGWSHQLSGNDWAEGEEQPVRGPGDEAADQHGDEVRGEGDQQVGQREDEQGRKNHPFLGQVAGDREDRGAECDAQRVHRRDQAGGAGGDVELTGNGR